MRNSQWLRHARAGLVALSCTALAAPAALAEAPLPLTGAAWRLADEAYKAYARGDYAQAAAQAREAARLRPDVPRIRALLEKSEAALVARPSRAGKRPAARSTVRPTTRRQREASATTNALATPSAAMPASTAGAAPASTPSRQAALPAAEAMPPKSPAYFAAEAAYAAQARGDNAAAASHASEAARLEPGNAGYARLVASLQATLAYDAVRRGDDASALAAFNQADAAGQLPNTAWQDAAFAAVRAGEDRQAVAYFSRAIDDADALKLKMSPQLLFETRRAVAEVSRQGGVIASLSYRGAVPGVGLVPGAGGNSAQAGVEAYWRPWGYRNGRYAELFARAFETLYAQDGGATGSGTAQAALGIRYKPMAESNTVVSFSRVFAPSGGRNDWLAQLAWSGGTGGDLRVDSPDWWTTRLSAEAGRYLQAGQTYALAQAQAGRSFRVGGEDGRWVLYPHLALAADYDSRAIEASAVGFGPGIGARYWFNEDAHNAPRSYLDLTLQYRVRVSGAQRAKGLFLNTLLSY